MVNDNPIFQKLNYKFDHIDFTSENSNNETGFEDYIVPNIIHYIQLENPFIDFITLISIISTIRHHKPKILMIHIDVPKLRGKYWEKISELNSSQIDTTIILNHIKRPRYIYHRKLSSIYHASDIARLRVLRKYGGIYLDNDVYVVKSLNAFRKFEFSIGWPINQYLGTQVLICHRNARFLHQWYESYRNNYKADKWYYNAGEFPTKNILEKTPNLVHRVIEEFGVQNLVQMLYNELNRNWQDQYYTIHLLARHRSYLIGQQEEFRYFNEYNIQNYNKTFGEMARLAYYGTKSVPMPNS